MVIAVIGLIAVIKIFPTNAQYFQDRFRSWLRSGHHIRLTARVPDWENCRCRWEYWCREDYFRMGPVTEDQEPSVPVMKSITSDMVWPEWHTGGGIIGIVVFILLYVYAFLKSYRIFVKSTGLISHMGLMFMIILVSQILEELRHGHFYLVMVMQLAYGILRWLPYSRTKCIVKLTNTKNNNVFPKDNFRNHSLKRRTIYSLLFTISIPICSWDYRRWGGAWGYQISFYWWWPLCWQYLGNTLKV